MARIVPQVCLRAIIHFPEESLQLIAQYIPNAHDFVFEATDDITAFLFAQSLCKVTNREAPGITFKCILHSGDTYNDAAWGSYFAKLIEQEVQSYINNKSEVNNALENNQLCTCEVTEVFSFCS